MKILTLELKNDRQFTKEFVMCRKKHITKLVHEYTWIGNADSQEVIMFPISTDLYVVRYHHNGDDETEMSITHIQNGKGNVIFQSEDLKDYETFEEQVKRLKEEKRIQRVHDSDYI